MCLLLNIAMRLDNGGTFVLHGTAFEEVKLRIAEILILTLLWNTGGANKSNEEARKHHKNIALQCSI